MDNIVITTKPQVDLGNCFIEYLWNDGSTDQTGYYSVTVTNVYNCSGTDEIYVESFSIPDVNLGGEQATEDGQSITPDAGDGYDNCIWQDSSLSPQITQIRTDLTFLKTILISKLICPFLCVNPCNPWFSFHHRL